MHACLTSSPCLPTCLPLTLAPYLFACRAVEVVCREGPSRVMELVRMGADFTRNNDGTLHLTQEGGHGQRRIVHAADLTGAEIERALLTQARSHASISFFEHHLAVDLVTDEHEGMQHCFGADVLDQRNMQVSRCELGLHGAACVQWGLCCDVLCLHLLSP